MRALKRDARTGRQHLGNWVHSMKRSQARGELRTDWAQRLEALPGWKWGVDADRDWAATSNLGGLVWLRPEGTKTVGLDRRLRRGNLTGLPWPINEAERRPTAWVHVYPPLQRDTLGSGPTPLACASTSSARSIGFWWGSPVGACGPSAAWRCPRYS